MKKRSRALALAWALAGALSGVACDASWAEGLPGASPAASATAPDAASIKHLPTYQDAALLGKAWGLPVAARYKPQLEFQHNMSFCGPTSLANVLHSLGRPASQSAMLEGTDVTTILGYLPKGLTLDELADVARLKLTGQRVTVLRGLDLPAFRQHLQQTNDPRRRYVVNFSREPLFGKGGGHHSPIAGYLAQEDLVLVLDVNSDFGPWLVKPERLWAAMNTVDGSAGKLRGLLLIEQGL